MQHEINMCAVLNSCSDRVTFFMVFNNVVEPKSGVTMLNSIVDNIEQCGPYN